MNEHDLIENNNLIRENDLLRNELASLKNSFALQKKSLEESEKRFSSLINATSQIVWVCTPRGDVVEDSPSWRNFTGQTVEEYLGLAFLEAIHPDDREKTIYNWRNAVKNSTLYETEYRLRKKDGTYAYMSARATPVYNNDGTIKEWVGTNADITKNKLFEDELKYQVYLTKTITNNATAALFMIDKNGYCTFMNPAAEEITGFTFEEIQAKPLHELIHHTHIDGTHYPISECALGKSLSENTSLLTYEDTFIRKDGSFFYAKCTARAILDKNAPVSTVIEIRDITEKKINEEKFRFLAETIPQLVWTSEPDGFTDYFNSKWNEYAGFNPSQIEGSRWEHLIHPEDLIFARDIWLKSITSGERYEIEYRIRRYDGHYRWFIARAIPFKNEKNQIIKWFGTATDIDEQKAIEEKQKFLVHISTRLISSIDYNTTLKNIAQMAVPYFADWCKVDLLSEDKKHIKMIAVAHKDKDKIKFAYELDEKYPRSIDSPLGSANVIRTGQPEYVREITEEMWDATDKESEFIILTRSLGLKSVITVPIFAKNKSIGSITFINAESGKLYTEDDVKIAEDLARKASLAIDNAILYSELDEEVKFNETLYRIGSTVVAEMDLGKIVQMVTDETTSLVGAEFGAFFYNLVDEKGESYTLYTISGVPYEEFSKFPMPRNTAIFAPTFDGIGIVRSNDITKDPRYGKNEPYYGMPEGHLPVRSYLAVPVKSKDGSVIGGLFFGHSKTAVFKEHNERLTQGIANLAAIAMDNAALYKRTSEAEGKFRLVTEAIPQIIWTVNSNGVIDYYNQSWYTYTGMKLNETSELKDVIHPDDLQRAVEKWLKVLKTGEVYEIEYRLKRSDGAYRWHLVRAVPFKNEKDEVIKWFGTFTDIQNQKEIEEKMEYKTSELENLNKELENFAYVASHDLQEPLRTITSFANLLEKRYKDKIDENANDFLDLITQGAKRMSNLISDLLLYSKVGMNPEAYKIIDLNKTLLMVKSNMQTLIEENSVTISSDILPTLKVNETQIIQLFQNLISNSIKYRSEENPVINISAKELDKEYLFSVSDNGIGINKQYHEKIFIIFKRLHEKGKYEGTGIGLATCKKIVDYHHGKIWLDSHEGKGTTFYFTLQK